MKVLNETMAEKVGGGEQWGFLRPLIQIPGAPIRPEPFSIAPIFD